MWRAPFLPEFCGGSADFAPLDAPTQTNVTDAVIAMLSKQYGGPVDPSDTFAYVAALPNSVYTENHRADLIRPGLRVPLTARQEAVR